MHQALDAMLTIYNSSSQVAVADLGDDRKSNIVLTVIFPDGTAKICRVAQHEGLARIGGIKIQPGGSILNPWS